MFIAAAKNYAKKRAKVKLTASESHPSAEASSVLHRPSGASMDAAASMPMVWGSSVSSDAAAMARLALPPRRSDAARAIDAREEEQAVSMLMAGPVHQEQHLS